jgi:signal transduction histidine kinase
MTNEQLMLNQIRIEEQAEELRAHSENLKDINDILVDKQQIILKQSEQLKETNQELSLLNATKDRFFSIIAHDLRNPFNVVSGFTEILLNKFDKLPVEKILKFLGMIHTSSTSGNALLENLLQWSRSQTGRISYEPANLNLIAIAEETIKFLEGDAERKHISLHIEIEPQLIVFVDENMIKTIIRNLISNAIKFTGENGTITLKSKTDGQMVTVSVADTGMGIPAETISKLFRVDTIVTTKGTAKESGTGLGLLLCKEFIEKHNGKIWIESEVGKGSEFKFTLPLI